jgi:large subunit ribosomal protein L24
MALKIRRDDVVKVINGKDRGRTGRVLRVDAAASRVYVEGVNLQKRHVKPRVLTETQTQAPQTGGIIESEGPVHVSNVMLVDPKTNDPTRVGIRREDGQRVRYSKRSGEVID